MPAHDVTVTDKDAGKRIDRFLSEIFKTDLSRTKIERLIKTGKVWLNNEAVSCRTKVQVNDRVYMEWPEEQSFVLQPQQGSLSILYEDKDVLVIDKPSGLVVHPGHGHHQGTLVHILLGHTQELSDVNGVFRPGIVHRLDKDASGLLLIAKNNTAHRKLQVQFEEHSIVRTYLALVQGRIEFEEGHVELPIGRHPVQRQKMAVRFDKSKSAKTFYRVAKRFKHHTLLEVRLQTGRTHQIRVHMAHLGHPVLGDAQYGSRGPWKRLALHARKLKFRHPTTDEWMEFESPIPLEINDMIHQLET